MRGRSQLVGVIGGGPPVVAMQKTCDSREVPPTFGSSTLIRTTSHKCHCLHGRHSRLMYAATGNSGTAHPARECVGTAGPAIAVTIACVRTSTGRCARRSLAREPLPRALHSSRKMPRHSNGVCINRSAASGRHPPHTLGSAGIIARSHTPNTDTLQGGRADRGVLQSQIARWRTPKSCYT